MSKRALIGAVLGIVLLGVGAWYILAGRGENLTYANVERRSIDVSIQTVGTFQARQPLRVRTASAGRIELVAVEVGDTIAAGDVVAVIDQIPFDDAITAAEADLERAEFALETAEINLAAEPGNRQRLGEAAAATESRRKAQLALDRANQAKRDAVVTASGAGIVVELSVRQGDSVTNQQVLATVVDPADLILVADVDELDVPNISVGSAVTFRPDAFPGTEINGTITSIAPQAVMRGGTTLFPSNVEFEPADVPLRPGMNAEVTIITAARENVLMVPDGALTTVGERTFVRVDTGSGSREQEVRLGQRHGGWSEVVSGLSDGDRVVVRR